jgi:hypothetical protein
MRWIEVSDDFGNVDLINLETISKINLLGNLISISFVGSSESTWIYSRSSDCAKDKYRDVFSFIKQTFMNGNLVLKLESSPREVSIRSQV